MASPSTYDCYEEELQSFLEALYAILQQSVPHEGIQDSGFVLFCFVRGEQPKKRFFAVYFKRQKSQWQSQAAQTPAVR